MGENGLECNVHRDGICGLHNVEVERRKANREKIEQTQANVDKLDTMKRVVWGLVGTSALYLLIFTLTLANISGSDKKLDDYNKETSQRIVDLTLLVNRVALMVEIRDKGTDRLEQKIDALSSTVDAVQKEQYKSSKEVLNNTIDAVQKEQYKKSIEALSDTLEAVQKGQYKKSKDGNN